MAPTHSMDHPPAPQTPQEIAAFIDFWRNAPESDHAHTGGMATEHEALVDLVPRGDATHIAIKDGAWSDPGIWWEGRIPDADASVLVPHGISVTYDQVSNASLWSVRVDGTLAFDTDSPTRLVVDTFVVSPIGRLEMGTEDNPITSTTEIVFADNGDINVAWDPTLLSRGLISHGSVSIVGEEKTAFLTVAEAPMAGDDELLLDGAPAGWEVGDTLVITGTTKQGWAWDNTLREVVHHESEDEVVTITAIDGNRITLDRALIFDHAAPRADLSAHVANTTRSITFTSEEQGDDVHDRGHVMFMHNDDVDVRYAAFDGLGRTDKSQDAFDVGTLPVVESDSNIKGRYAFHFHKTSVDDKANPALAIGNVVTDNPGWGFVHHSSHANFIDNVSFDVFGAGFAAEDGNETGIWSGNLAIKSEGIGWGDWTVKESDDVARHDNGRTGDGFFFAGRMVEASDNIAANTTHGFVWMHRSAPAAFDPEISHHPDMGYGLDHMSPDDSPIQGFRDNEAYGTEVGLIVLKANTAQGHDLRSILDGFTNWETRNGVNFSYTGHYTMIDFDLLATERTGFFAPGMGVDINTNAFDMVLNGLKVSGFDVGMDFENDYTYTFDPANVGFIVIDPDWDNNGTAFTGFDSTKHKILTSDDLVDGRLRFNQDSISIGPNQDLPLSGTKTDSIGTIDRTHDGDDQTLMRWEVENVLRANGYYKTEAGVNVMLLPDFIADRATGEFLKMTTFVTLRYSDAELQRIGVAYQGVYDPDRPPVDTAPLTFYAKSGAMVYDLPFDGALSDVVDPRNGNAWVEGGELAYRALDGFSGRDTTTYWMDNGHGVYSQNTVTFMVNHVERRVIDSVGARVNTFILPAGLTPTIMADIESLEGVTLWQTEDGIAVWSNRAGTHVLSIAGHAGEADLRLTFTQNAETRNAVTGTDGANALLASEAGSVLRGAGGLDTLVGHDGEDLFYGGTETDRIEGKGGRDVMHGGEGADVLFGGAGHDVVYGGNGFGLDVIYAGTGDDLVYGGGSRDSLFGGDGMDVLYGGEGADNLEGEEGNDRLDGGEGFDKLYGGNGEDVLYGRRHDDSLNGGARDDVLYGGSGHDSLFGGTGNDSLHSGSGRDVLSGGAGVDVFIWATAQEMGNGSQSSDVLMDFTSGEDRLDVSELWHGDHHLAVPTTIGSAFTGVAGQIIRSAGRVMIDLDGDGQQDATFMLDASAALDIDDFMFHQEVAHAA